MKTETFSAGTAPADAVAGIAISDWGALMLLSVLWGSSFIFYRYLDRVLSPEAVVFGRLVFGGAALHVLLASRRDRLRLSDGLWKKYLVLGALNNAIPFTLVAWSEVELPSGISATIGATAPLFGVVISMTIQGRSSVTKGRLLALLLGFAGVVLVTMSRSESAGRLSLLSCGAGLLSSFVYSVGGFYSSRFSGTSPLQTATGQITAASLLLLIVVVVRGSGSAVLALEPHAMLALLVMGVACTGVPYIVFFRLIRRIGSANVLLVAMMIPIASLVIGYFALGEAIGAPQLAGLALIILALMLIDGRIRWPGTAAHTAS